MLADIFAGVMVGVGLSLISSFGTLLGLIIIGQLLKEELEKGIYTNLKLFIILGNIIIFLSNFNDIMKNDSTFLYKFVVIFSWITTLYILYRITRDKKIE